MNKLLLASLTLFTVVIFSSCYIVKGNTEYLKGLDSLKEGNEIDAVAYFEESIKFDPRNTESLDRLTEIYLKNGEIKKAWVYSRKSVLCEAKKDSKDTFFYIYKILFNEEGLDKVGTPYDDIIAGLGEPDKIERDDMDECSLTQVTYGLVHLLFSKGKLKNKVIIIPIY